MQHMTEQAPQKVAGSEQEQIEEHGKEKKQRPGDGNGGKGHADKDAVQRKGKA